MKWQIKYNAVRDEKMMKALEGKAIELAKCPTTNTRTFVAHLTSMVRVWMQENPKTQTYPVNINVIKDTTVDVRWEKQLILRIKPKTK